MRLFVAAVVAWCGCSIEPATPVTCGERICPPGSVCRSDGTCEPPLRSPATLVFDNTASVTDLIEFPVLAAIDARRIAYEQVIDPTTDLRFHDPDTDTDLPFDIERWDPAGESFVWVRVPTIDARSGSDKILMYFGRDENAGGGSGAAVWQGFDLVAHGEPEDRTNAAGGAIVEINDGIAFAPGPAGDAYQLAGPGAHQVMFANSESLFSGWSQFTLELWMYCDYEGSALGSVEPRVVENGGALQLGRLISLAPLERFLRLQIDIELTVGMSYVPTIIPTRTWVYVVYTYDGQTLWIYRNGSFADLSAAAEPAPLVAGSNPLVLGSPHTPLQGALDEVRASKAYRDPDWVNAQYLAMTRKFITFR